MECGRPWNDAAIPGIGGRRPGVGRHCPAIGRARAQRFRSGVRGNEPRHAGRDPHGRRSAHHAQPEAGFRIRGAHRLPAIYELSLFARDGGLMSYGPDLDESFGRVASLVDRILKGAKPAELPFEQPTLFPFVLNLRTAQSLAVEIPPAILARVDEVIE